MALPWATATDIPAPSPYCDLVDRFARALKDAGFSSCTVSHGRAVARLFVAEARDTGAATAESLTASPVLEAVRRALRASASYDRRISLSRRLVAFVLTGDVSITGLGRLIPMRLLRTEQLRPKRHAARPVSSRVEIPTDHTLAKVFLGQLTDLNERWQKRAKYALRGFCRWLTTVLPTQEHLASPPGEPDLTRVEATHITGYLDSLATQGKSAAVRRLQLQSLRRWFAFLCSHNHIPTDPTRPVDPIKGRECAPERILTAPEVEAFLRAVASFSSAPVRDLALFGCLSGLGLRPAEVLGLTLGDIDHEGSTIRVLGKGNRERLVPLSGPVLLGLQWYLRERQAPESAASPLWVDEHGAPLTYNWLRRAFHRFRSHAGLALVGGPHVFRHFFITENLLAGADPTDMAALVGHSHIRALQPYVHVGEVDMRRALVAAFGDGLHGA